MPLTANNNTSYGTDPNAGADEVELVIGNHKYEVNMTDEAEPLFGASKFNNEPLLSKSVNNLKLHTRNEFEDTKEFSEAVWSSLPDSINGTLIYFLLVEQNTKSFPVGEYFQVTFLTGLPVFFTFWIQGLLIYWISDITPDYEDSSICIHSALLQHAVMMVFLLFMYPSLSAIMTESYVCLRANRVGFTHEQMDDKILLYQIRAPLCKRLVTFLLVPFVEVIILTAMTVVGSKFISTCEKTSDLIINSMAVAFVMDVDNLAREYFQNEEVTEHVDGMHFETKIAPDEGKLSTIETVHDDAIEVHEEVDPETVATFWCVEKMIALWVIAASYTYSLQYLYCQEAWIDGSEQ